MDTQTLLWILGTIVLIQLAVIGGIVHLMVSHGRDCRDYRVKNAEHNGQVDAKLERIIEDIGDHESGIRGSIHQLIKDIAPMVVRAQFDLEQRSK